MKEGQIIIPFAQTNTGKFAARKKKREGQQKSPMELFDECFYHGKRAHKLSTCEICVHGSLAFGEPETRLCADQRNEKTICVQTIAELKALKEEVIETIEVVQKRGWR